MAKKSASRESVDPVMDSVNKDFGSGTAFFLTDKTSGKYDGIPTGSLLLDRAIGGYGWPLGRSIELYGELSTGKSSLALTSAREAQKLGEKVAYIDIEHALNPSWAEHMGVDLSKMPVIQPDSAEQALQICEKFLVAGKHRLIIIDSVAAMSTKAEVEGDIGDAHVAGVARLMGQTLRKFTSTMAKNGVAIIFINQIRELIAKQGHNAPTTYTPGGRALKFMASVRVELWRKAAIRDSDKHDLGMSMRAKVVKNKMAAPYREANYDFYFDRGICRATEAYDLGIQNKILKTNSCSFGDVSWSGRVDAVEKLVKQPQVVELLIQEVIKKEDKTAAEEKALEDAKLKVFHE